MLGEMVMRVYRKSIGNIFLFGLTTVLSVSPILLGANVVLAEASNTPSKEISQIMDSVREVVKSQTGKIPEADLDAKLREIIYPVFNFEEMSKRCVAGQWDKASAAEQKEFVELFGDLLGKTYLKRIKRNIVSSVMTVLSETVDGDKGTVKTKVKTDEETVSLDYRLSSTNSKWQIYDVVIENVGLVSNYRNEFGSEIRKNGFPGLLAKLREKKATGIEKAEAGK